MKTVQRPNIDHLIKRVLLERKRETKKNIRILCISFLVVVIVAYILIQN